VWARGTRSKDAANRGAHDRPNGSEHSACDVGRHVSPIHWADVAPWAQQAATQQLPASSCPAEPEGAPPLAVATVRFLDAPGRPGVRVEVARSNAQRARGLMYRTSLSEDEGMIFVWSEEAPRSFWMHNTCVALDMLFVDREGYIAGILEQVPTLNDLPRAVPCPAQFVIETKAGFCRRHGVSPGQRVAIDG
jgi:uncharacterized membrane protein (UPF0127 family)